MTVSLLCFEFMFCPRWVFQIGLGTPLFLPKQRQTNKDLSMRVVNVNVYDVFSFKKKRKKKEKTKKKTKL